MRNHESFWKTVVAVMDSFHSSGGASVTSCGLYYHGYSNSEVIKTCLPVFLCGFCLSSAWCTLLSIHCDLSQNKTRTTKTESEVTNKNTDTRIHVRSCNIFYIADTLDWTEGGTLVISWIHIFCQKNSSVTFARAPQTRGNHTLVTGQGHNNTSDSYRRSHAYYYLK